MSLSLSDLPNPVNEDSPKWYIDSRQLAWQKFLESPWPSRKDEDWRFANLKKLSYENVRDSEQIVNFDYNKYVSNSISLTLSDGWASHAPDRVRNNGGAPSTIHIKRSLRKSSKIRVG